MIFIRPLASLHGDRLPNTLFFWLFSSFLVVPRRSRISFHGYDFVRIETAFSLAPGSSCQGLLTRFPCIVIIKRRFILLLILFFMNARNISKSIVTLFEMLFRPGLFLRLIFISNSLISSPSLHPVKFHYLECKLGILDMHVLIWHLQKDFNSSPASSRHHLP